MPKEIQTLWRVRQSWHVGRVGVVAVTSSWSCSIYIANQSHPSAERFLALQVGAPAGGQNDPCSNSCLHILCKLLTEWAERWEFTALVSHRICYLLKGCDQQSGLRKWGNLCFNKSRIPRLSFLTPFPIATAWIYSPLMDDAEGRWFLPGN